MQKRLPDYLKRPIINTDKTRTVRRILKTKCLNTVCENARCPNKDECYTKNTATFLIMGNNCTRNCRYCNITCSKPEPLDGNEPLHIAQAVKDLGLKYAVITSVTRDDLPDGVETGVRIWKRNTVQRSYSRPGAADVWGRRCISSIF